MAFYSFDQVSGRENDGLSRPEQLLAEKSERCDLTTHILRSTIGRHPLKLEIIMKAIIVKAPGGLDRVERIEQPDPGPPGPGTIRVRLHASSLNFHDYGVVSTPNRVSDGRIPMSDGAGVVEAVGEGVTEFKVNDRVVSCFFPGWADGAPAVADFSTVPGDGVDGYAREVVVALTTAFTRAPKGYSFAEAATLTTAGVTAWRALVVNGALKAGDKVLVLGTGGVSIFALQIAKAMGATVFVTSSSDEKLQRAHSLGADHTINYRRHPDWGARVREMAGGVGVNHVIEVGGPGTLGQSITAVTIGGHIALIGVLTGRAGEVATAQLMAKQARLHGLIVGSRKHQLDFVRAIDAAGIKPVIDRSFDLDEIADAFRYEASGQHFGKICLEF
jgi:NADPH:quinone reductase-like Zn-dependent oxidoreductase